MTEIELTKAAIERVLKWPEPNDYETKLRMYELTRLRHKLRDLEKANEG